MLITLSFTVSEGFGAASEGFGAASAGFGVICFFFRLDDFALVDVSAPSFDDRTFLRRLV